MPSPASPARILQVDADAFYVQVARLVDPDGVGRTKLLLVGGSPKGRGVVTSASYEARKHGARSGMAMAQALRLCPEATVVGVPRRACAERSRAIVRVLERFTPVVEPASIDEMYLDLSGTESLYHQAPLETIARKVRAAVLDETAVVVSIGGGTNRLIAKLAAGRAKPHRTPEAEGVLVVAPGDEATFLETFELAAIPGIGPRFQERLASHGLTTVPDALRHDVATLARWFGDRAGRWLYDRIRGVNRTPVIGRERAKSISRDETFAEDIDDESRLRRELLRLSDRATADLRKHGYAARTISVRIRDRDFRDRRASRTLPTGVNTERIVFDTALELFAKLRKARPIPARLLSVSLSQITGTETEEQLALFPESPLEASLETERDRRLANALDAVRNKYGPGALGRGG